MWTFFFYRKTKSTKINDMNEDICTFLFMQHELILSFDSTQEHNLTNADM